MVNIGKHDYDGKTNNYHYKSQVLRTAKEV